jgi:hypothetical protein
MKTIFIAVFFLMTTAQAQFESSKVCKTSEQYPCCTESGPYSFKGPNKPGVIELCKKSSSVSNKADCKVNAFCGAVAQSPYKCRTSVYEGYVIYGASAEEVEYKCISAYGHPMGFKCRANTVCNK